MLGPCGPPATRLPRQHDYVGACGYFLLLSTPTHCCAALLNRPTAQPQGCPRAALVRCYRATAVAPSILEVEDLVIQNLPGSANGSSCTGVASSSAVPAHAAAGASATAGTRLSQQRPRHGDCVTAGCYGIGRRQQLQVSHCTYDKAGPEAAAAQQQDANQLQQKQQHQEIGIQLQSPSTKLLPSTKLECGNGAAQKPLHCNPQQLQPSARSPEGQHTASPGRSTQEATLVHPSHLQVCEPQQTSAVAHLQEQQQQPVQQLPAQAGPCQQQQQQPAWQAIQQVPHQQDQQQQQQEEEEQQQQQQQQRRKQQQQQQQVHGTAADACRLRNKEFVKAVKAAASPQQLAALLQQQHAGALDAISATAATSRAAQLLSSDSSDSGMLLQQQRRRFVSQHLQPLLQRHCPSMDAVGVTTCICSLARLGCGADSEPLAGLLQRSGSSLQQQRPRGLAQTLWSFAELRLVPGPAWLARFESCCCATMPSFAAQDCAQVLLAYAQLRVVPGPRALARLLERVQQLLPELQPRAASNILYSLAVLRVQPEEPWMQAVLAQVQQQLGSYCHASLGLLCYALAVQQRRPPDAWLRAFYAGSAAQLQHASPQNLCHMLMASAAWRQRPPPQWMQQHQVACYGRMLQFTSQGLAVLALSLERISYRPANAWLSHFEQQACGQLKHALPATYASITLLFGRVQHCPSARSQRLLLQGAAGCIDSFDAQRLGQLCWGLQQLPAWQLPAGFLDAVAHAVSQRLASFLPAALAAAAGFLASRGFTPSSGWVLNTSGQFGSKAAAASCEDLVVYSEALASWGTEPGRWFWSSLSSCCASRARELEPRQVQRLLAACVRLGSRLSPEALLELHARLDEQQEQEQRQSTQQQEQEQEQEHLLLCRSAKLAGSTR